MSQYVQKAIASKTTSYVSEKKKKLCTGYEEFQEGLAEQETKTGIRAKHALI